MVWQQQRPRPSGAREQGCSSTSCRMRRSRRTFPLAPSGERKPDSISPAASGCPTPATDRSRPRPKTICGRASTTRPRATRQPCSCSTARKIAGCRGTRQSGRWHSAIAMSPGIRKAPTDGSAPTCRLPNLSRSPGTPGRAEPRADLALLHVLLDLAAQGKQPLVDRGRHVADEFDDAVPVLENAGFPEQLIAEFIELGLIVGRIILQSL